MSEEKKIQKIPIFYITVQTVENKIAEVDGSVERSRPKRTTAA